jgi:hypothetical protein
MSRGETMRAFLVAAHALALLAACNTTDAPPPGKDVQATSAATANGVTVTSTDALASCRQRSSSGATQWACPHDVGAVDIQSKHRDDTKEIADNLDLFAQPMMGDGGKRDDGDFLSGGAHYRSVKVSGQVPGKGPIFARMVVVDREPTRYVSCGAKTDACDDVVRAVLAREPAPALAPAEAPTATSVSSKGSSP